MRPRIAERVVGDGDERGGAPGRNLGATEARALLRAMAAAVAPARTRPGADRGGCRPTTSATRSSRGARAQATSGGFARRGGSLKTEAGDSRRSAAAGRWKAATLLFEAAIPVVPYVPATAFLGKERARLAPGEGAPAASRWWSTGRLHARGHGTRSSGSASTASGYEVDVIGIDPRVDRRLPAVAESRCPLYPDSGSACRASSTWSRQLGGGRYDLVHVCLARPGRRPGGPGLADRAGSPLIGSYHTEFAAYAGVRSRPRWRAGRTARAALWLFYGQCARCSRRARKPTSRSVGLGIDRRDRPLGPRGGHRGPDSGPARLRHKTGSAWLPRRTSPSRCSMSGG